MVVDPEKKKRQRKVVICFCTRFPPIIYGSLFHSVDAPLTFSTQQSAHGVTVSLKQACVARFAVPQGVPKDINVQGFTGAQMGAREVTFQEPPPHGSVFSLHCIGDTGGIYDGI